MTSRREPRPNGIGGVAVTKCPPGAARGARDLQQWSQRRALGWSGAGRDSDWIDQFTRLPRLITCRECGHSKKIEISEAKLARVTLRCRRCGTPHRR